MIRYFFALGIEPIFIYFSYGLDSQPRFATLFFIQKALLHHKVTYFFWCSLSLSYLLCPSCIFYSTRKSCLNSKWSDFVLLSTSNPWSTTLHGSNSTDRSDLNTKLSFLRALFKHRTGSSFHVDVSLLSLKRFETVRGLVDMFLSTFDQSISQSH